MSRGLSMTRTANKYSSLPALPASLKILFVAVDAVVTGAHSGTGDSLTKAGSIMTLTDSAGAFVANDHPSFITLAGWPSAANNGTWPTTSVPGATQISFTNAAGVAESSASATYRCEGRCTSLTDRVAGIVCTPTGVSTALAIAIDATTGKKLLSSHSVLFTPLNMTGTDVGGVLSALAGDVDVSLYAYGMRGLSGGTTGASRVVRIMGSSVNDFIQLAFSGTTNIRMLRSRSIAPNSGSDSSNAASVAGVNVSDMRRWCVTRDNTAGGPHQAFRDETSLAAAVNPTSNKLPLQLDNITLGPTIANEFPFTWKAIGVFDTVASVGDQTSVRDYVNALY